ncbi:MAG TPA: hypothetical protein VG865_09315, partial [Casimicrobiaceae bacterium]|nr:hypothetical protein [Casimicrobiaceae bacterium]
VAGVLAGVAYYGVNMVLLSFALSLEARQRWTAVLKEQFLWLLPHYVGYGVVAGVMASAQRLGLTKIGIVGSEQFIGE